MKSVKYLLSTTFLLGLLAFSCLAQAEDPLEITVPPDVSLECGGSTDPSNTGTANASGGCDGGEDLAISFSDFILEGICSGDLTIERTWTATDSCGNTASAKQYIYVQDTTAPSPPASPADLNLECASDTPPPIDLTAVDNCDGSITVSPSAVITPGSCGNDFNMVRTWTFGDVCGNTAAVSQTLDVLDDIAPVITCPPDGSYETATASDNCTSPVSPTFTDNPYGTRTSDATDECDNSAMCTIILCEADPMTAGYWHRQCLGVAQEDGGLSPSRKGKGPKSPTEPDFEELLMECADLELADLGFFLDDTCSGIDARPASDDCERALRQLTALVLNVCSGRLQEACPVCLASCGFDEADGSVAELINEITADIQGGFCKQAAEKAALVNEGEGLCVLDN